MAFDITVRPATDEDIPGIVNVLVKVFGKKYGKLNEQLYPWYFRNPYVTRERSPGWVAVKNGAVVGHMTVCPVSFKVYHQKIVGFFDAGLAVDPSCRRMGIASKIYNAAIKVCPFILSASSTDVGGGLEESFGFYNFMNVPRLFKVLRPQDYLPKAVSWIPGLSIPLKRYYHNWGQKRPISGVKKIRSEDIATLDPFFENALEDYNIAMYRDASFISWRYLNLPTWPYEIAVAREKGTMEGLIVYRVFERNGRKVGRICDFLVTAHGLGWLHSLLEFAVLEMNEAGCSAVETYCEASPATKDIFVAQGFRQQRKGQVDFRVYSEDKQLAQRIRNERPSWFLTPGDVDLDLN